MNNKLNFIVFICFLVVGASLGFYGMHIDNYKLVDIGTIILLTGILIDKLTQ